ncbi:DUF3221 domain-containing protein [Metabacillus fastidiosus]|uniref:DUF3221 domain-containing protein n=1 Tax=Metabacillus fastidiosus TaxID=1458 RepID=A0ABU6P0E0_9BACI|nr:DUF3221 domain-containing protein [Metabacillus fastidiosus]MED4401576.1 DUF3221 domain-containing protein [Metabacillus fastidiosus]MED4463211.1 DUF3221 domain-containing protein [Metabacillus fastidiosus]
MKRTVYLLLFVLLLLAGCNNTKEVTKDGIEEEFTMEGKILEISKEGNGIFMETDSISRIFIHLPNKNDLTKYEVGDEVIVSIEDGAIQESDPPQARALNIKHKNDKS